MGKVTGFIEWPRTLPSKRKKVERLKDDLEIPLSLNPEEAKRQAGRCMDCGVPFCHQGCPLGNPIPDFNDAIYRGDWKDAYLKLSATNNFPEFTGRLCPAPCEAACVLAINQDPVAIEQIEKEIIEKAFVEGWVQPAPPSKRTGKNVAVVGSGPAGLAAAVQLNQAGHSVTVYERAPLAGGLLRYGIPNFKMEKWVLDRRLKLMGEAGIQFQTQTEIGTTLDFNQLRASHHAVLLAIGARRPRELTVPGRQLRGVVQSLDFLAAATDGELGNLTGKNVMVLGGGDTGSDCLGTALRRGAHSVTQLELMPELPSSRSADNPWPQWPVTFRTSSSQEEGGDRVFGWMTQKLFGVDGALTGLVAVQVSLQPDETGKMSLREISRGERIWKVDVLVLALGFFGPDAESAVTQLGVVLTPRGTVQVNSRYQTSVPHVYCAGDAARGASLIVWAISEGREAARAIDSNLIGEDSRLPSRGKHLHFGGR